MRAQDKAGATIGAAGRWFLEQYVIRQHHRIALAKLPDDTFRLRLDAGQVRFVDQTVAVQMNDSRFHALAGCAAEIGWTMPLHEPSHSLTPLGQELVGAGDLPPSGSTGRSEP
jgi:hypothetical protein